MRKEESRILGRMEGKVDSLIIDLRAIRKDSGRKIDNLGVRVANLEKKQFTIVIIASAIFTGMLAYVKRFWI